MRRHRYFRVLFRSRLLCSEGVDAAAEGGPKTAVAASGRNLGDSIGIIVRLPTGTGANPDRGLRLRLQHEPAAPGATGSLALDRRAGAASLVELAPNGHRHGSRR